MDKEEFKLFKFFLENSGKLTTTFGDYSKIYSMTTENIYGFLKNYDLRDKSILTVNGSGDQLLNSILQGARDITCFDTNPFSFNNTRLKISASKFLNFEKFINFFGIYTKEYDSFYDLFDLRLFKEFCFDLDKDTYDIFNYIVNTFFNRNNINDIYFNFDNDLNKLEKFNNYLNPNSYSILSTILKEDKVNFEFIHSDIKNLKEKLGCRKFDFILLSNISDYIDDIFGDNYLEKYRNLIMELSDNLNLFGLIQVGYIYSVYKDRNLYSDFIDDNKRKKVFTTDMFHTVLVDSYIDLDKKDKIITYQKLRG